MYENLVHVCKESIFKFSVVVVPFDRRRSSPFKKQLCFLSEFEKSLFCNWSGTETRLTDIRLGHFSLQFL